MNARWTLLSLLSALCTVSIAPADTINLSASKDNTIFDESGSLSNGAGAFFFAGSTAGAAVRRGLLSFNVAGGIPAGSTINSVTLTLQVTRARPGAHNVAIHRVLSDWGEGTSDALLNEGAGAAAEANDATWSHAFWNTALWSSAGGDFVAAASATQLVDALGSFTWGSTATMVADVQLWLDSPADDFGWIVRGDEATTQSAKQIASRENSTPAWRPQLTVDFSPAAVPEPGTLALLLTGLAALAFLGRVGQRAGKCR